MLLTCKKFRVAQLVMVASFAHASWALSPKQASLRLPDAAQEVVEILDTTIDSEPAKLQVNGDGQVYVSLSDSPTPQPIKIQGTRDDGQGFVEYRVEQVFKLQDRIFAVARSTDGSSEKFLHELAFHRGSNAFVQLNRALAVAGVVVTVGAGYFLTQGSGFFETSAALTGMAAGVQVAASRFLQSVRAKAEVPPITNTTTLSSSGYRFRLATLVRDANGAVIDAYFKFKDESGQIRTAKLSQSVSCEIALAEN